MSAQYVRTKKLLEPVPSYGPVKVYGADGQLKRIIPAANLARDRHDKDKKTWAWTGTTAGGNVEEDDE